MASASSFYHYQDAQGVEVIVQRLDEIPVPYRAQAKRLDLGKSPASALAKEAPLERPVLAPAQPAPAKDFWGAFHGPSVALGAAISLMTGLVVVLLLRRRSRIASLLVGTLAMMAFGIGYLTFLRHQVGLRPAGLVTPATVLDDARAAALGAQKRLDQQEKTLDQINNLR